MKKLFLLLLLTISQVSFAQDSTSCSSNCSTSSTNTSFSIFSRNIWRGINWGNSSPVVQANLSYSYKNFEIGTFGTMTLTGTKDGWGNWIENYITYKKDKFSITVDDYYFFGQDSLTNYLSYSKTSGHLIEVRPKLSFEKVTITLSNCVYPFEKALYTEIEWFFRKDLSLMVSGITGKSTLNFNDRGGINTIGVSGYRDIIIKDTKLSVKSSIIFNPLYKSISRDAGVRYTGIGYNPVNWTIGIGL
jgi:hypothetical protein